MIDLRQQRIVITGGDGFLGRHVRAALREVGVAPGNVQVPHHRDFDLTRAADVERMYAEMRPTVVKMGSEVQISIFGKDDTDAR